MQTRDKIEQAATMPVERVDEARNWADSKETTEERTLVVACKREGYDAPEIHSAVVARWYMARRSDGASPVYCSVWVRPWAHGGVSASGRGTASGYGYCKRSAAFQAALDRAGIKLARAVDGVGMSAVDEAMRAVALAAGWPAVAVWGIV